MWIDQGQEGTERSQADCVLNVSTQHALPTCSPQPWPHRDQLLVWMTAWLKESHTKSQRVGLFHMCDTDRTMVFLKYRFPFFFILSKLHLITISWTITNTSKIAHMVSYKNKGRKSVISKWFGYFLLYLYIIQLYENMFLFTFYQFFPMDCVFSMLYQNEYENYIPFFL